MQSFRDIDCSDVCILLNVMDLNGTQFVVLKIRKTSTSEALVVHIVQFPSPLLTCRVAPQMDYLQIGAKASLTSLHAGCSDVSFTPASP